MHLRASLNFQRLGNARLSKNSTAAHTTMLGDRLHDIHAAQANALRSIGAAWGYGGRVELEEAGATAIAETPGSVPGLIA